MRASVTRAYTDRFDGSVHYPNTIVELSEARIRELSSKGFVAPAEEPEEAREEGAADGRGGDQADDDLGERTAAQLRELIEERGGSAPKRATKAQLLEIARGL